MQTLTDFAGNVSPLPSAAKGWKHAYSWGQEVRPQSDGGNSQIMLVDAQHHAVRVALIAARGSLGGRAVWIVFPAAPAMLGWISKPECNLTVVWDWA